MHQQATKGNHKSRNAIPVQLLGLLQHLPLVGDTHASPNLSYSCAVLNLCRTEMFSSFQ